MSAYPDIRLDVEFPLSTNHDSLQMIMEAVLYLLTAFEVKHRHDAVPGIRNKQPAP